MSAITLVTTVDFRFACYPYPKHDGPVDPGKTVRHWTVSFARRVDEPSVASLKLPLYGSTPLPELRALINRLRFLRSTLFVFVLTACTMQVGYALPVAQSCSVPGVQRSARCGTIEVLENPDRPGSRKLEVHFAVIPAA